MFQHIVVPLDGSALAEQALPTAARLARSAGGWVMLLRVVKQEARSGERGTRRNDQRGVLAQGKAGRTVRHQPSPRRSGGGTQAVSDLVCNA